MLDDSHNVNSSRSIAYVAGRYAAVAGFLPVTGNLFHHAIEMYIKGYLVPSTTEKERKAWGHKLPTLWAEFKQRVADPALDSFDDAITELQKFEDIRYPEPVVATGMVAGISFVKPTPPLTNPGRSEPVYQISLAEIDELVRIIFEKASRNPVVFLGFINEHVAAYLAKDNLHLLHRPIRSHQADQGPTMDEG